EGYERREDEFLVASTLAVLCTQVDGSFAAGQETCGIRYPVLVANALDDVHWSYRRLLRFSVDGRARAEYMVAKLFGNSLCSLECEPVVSHDEILDAVGQVLQRLSDPAAGGTILQTIADAHRYFFDQLVFSQYFKGIREGCRIGRRGPGSD